MNKKATEVIGTTLTWIVAMTLIAFIMFLYVVSILIIFGDKTFTKLDLPISEVNFAETTGQLDNRDFSKTKNLGSFLSHNREIISSWIDEGEGDGEYWKVCELFNDIEAFDLNSGFIYFEVNNPNTLLVEDIEYRKTLRIEELGGKISCKPSPQQFVLQSQLMSKIPFISDSGNLGEVTYYEK